MKNILSARHSIVCKNDRSPGALHREPLLNHVMGSAGFLFSMALLCAAKLSLGADAGVRGPEVRQKSPADKAIAVDPRTVVSALLWDETGVDTNSISFAVGTNSVVGLSDPRLSYAAGRLTYAPAANEILGRPGETVTVRVRVADTSGHLTTNGTWSFRLSLPTVLNTNVAFVGAMRSELGSNLVSVLSREGATMTYQYPRDQLRDICGHALGGPRSGEWLCAGSS